MPPATSPSRTRARQAAPTRPHAAPTPPRCICGHTYTAHPSGKPQTPAYRVARVRIVRANAAHVCGPDISDSHRAAITRARLERWAGAA